MKNYHQLPVFFGFRGSLIQGNNTDSGQMRKRTDIRGCKLKTECTKISRQHAQVIPLPVSNLERDHVLKVRLPGCSLIATRDSVRIDAPLVKQAVFPITQTYLFP